MDGRGFPGLGHGLVDTLGAYLEGCPRTRCTGRSPMRCGANRGDASFRPRDLAQGDPGILHQRVLPYGRGQNHPCFAAFVDPAASKLSMLAAFASAVTNTSGAGGEYAAIYLERLAVRWLMELIGFPRDGSDGVLLGGGSDANRHCMEVARCWGARANGWDIREEGLQGHPRLTMYMSDEGHSCLEKAAFTLGLGSPRKIAVSRDFRIDLDDLRAAVAADRRAGHRPFLVVANAGSVKTGAIDPLATWPTSATGKASGCTWTAPTAGSERLDPRLAQWFAGPGSRRLRRHRPAQVDGGRHRLQCAMVRHGELLQETYKLVPSYLSQTPGKGFAGHIWYSHRSAEQTRDSGRALKTIWNIQQAGRGGLDSHVRRHIDLARYMEQVIEASPDMELLATGPLTAVCFRYVPATWNSGRHGPRSAEPGDHGGRPDRGPGVSGRNRHPRPLRPALLRAPLRPERGSCGLHRRRRACGRIPSSRDAPPGAGAAGQRGAPPVRREPGGAHVRAVARPGDGGTVPAAAGPAGSPASAAGVRSRSRWRSARGRGRGEAAAHQRRDEPSRVPSPGA